MNYTLHQLQVFLKVVQHHSVTRAAEDMYMTQPAVSIQLRNFQQQFDFPLTEVIGKQLYITDLGQEVATMAERVLSEAEMIRYKMQAYQGLLTGKLKISSASTGKYVIPYFLADFLKNYRGIDLLLDVTNKARVVSSLKNNEIDFALVSVLPEGVSIEEEALLDNKLYCIGKTAQYRKDQPLIYREEGSATRAAMENYFGNPKAVRKRIELTSNEAVKQAIIAGLGYSILPLIGIRNELSNQQLRIVPLPGLPLLTQWRLIWLRSKKLSPVAQAFLDYTRAKKTQILKNEFNWYLHFSIN